MADFGLVRRTGSAATLRRGGRNGRIRLSLATDRPLSRSEDQDLPHPDPWRTVKVWLTYGIWKDVSIRVPRRYRGAGPLEIRVATDDYWFPADEWGNDDLRCLGVLVRPTALVQPGSSRRRRLDLRLRATVRRFWRRVSRCPMRLLSAWASQLRPAGAAQRLPRADEDPAREAEAKRLEQMTTRLYRTVLGRSPDAAGLDGWMDLLVNGFCVPIQVAQFFVSSTEFRAIYGDDPTPEHFVAIACRNTLGHDPDPPDSRRWADFLAEHGNGTPARAATALGIMNAMARPDRPTVATGAHPAIPRPHFKSRAASTLAVLIRTAIDSVWPAGGRGSRRAGGEAIAGSSETARREPRPPRFDRSSHFPLRAEEPSTPSSPATVRASDAGSGTDSGVPMRERSGRGPST